MQSGSIVIPALLFLCILSLPAQQRNVLRGTISDASNGEALPAANIRILGTSRGTISNLQGEYLLSIDSLPCTIVFSYLAYLPETLAVKPSIPLQQNIRLQPSPIRLPEVVILAEDPAVDIIRQAIAHKHEWMDRLKSYSFRAFTRQVMMRDTGIAGITESYSEGYQNAKDTLREIIRQRRQTQNVPMEDNMASVRRIVNFNDDQIRLFSVTIDQNSADYRFVGPTASDALDNYDYRLLRTSHMNGVDIYHIRMTPKSNLKPLFDGEITIAGRTYAVMGVDVKPNEVFVVPFLKDIDLRYRQEFGLYDSIFWMPTNIRITGGFTVSIIGLSLPRIGLSVTSSIYDYAINPLIPDSILHKPRLVVDSAAAKFDSTFWAGNQILPLTGQEQHAYQTLDSTQTIEKQFEPKGPLAVIGDSGTGDVIGMLDARFNRVEGLFLGIKKEATTLSRILKYETGVGYGFSDRKVKYRVGATLFTSKEQRLGFGGVVYREMGNVPDEGYYGPLLISVTSLFGRNDYRDYYLANGWMLTGIWKPNRKAGLTVSMVSEEESSVPLASDFSLAAGTGVYRPNPAVRDGSMRSLVFGAELGETAVPLGMISRKAAVFSVEFSSPEVTGGDFSFTRYSGLLTWSIPTFSRSFLFPQTLRFQLTGGIGTGDLPPQRIFSLESRAGGYAPFGVLHGSGIRECTGDRFVMLNIEHNFRSIPFLLLRLPFLYRNSIELVCHGSFAQSWNGRTSTSGGWYSEAGIGLSRLLDLLRLDCTYRFKEPAGISFSVSIATLF